MAGLAQRIASAGMLMAFLALFAAAALRGGPGPWHERCVQFWSLQQWTEIRSLAQNLSRTGESDAEATYFAALSAQQMKDPEAARTFALQFSQHRALNLKWESRVAALTQPQSLRERFSFMRARASLGLLAAIVCINLAAALRRGKMLGLSGLLSAAGIVLLLL